MSQNTTVVSCVRPRRVARAITISFAVAALLAGSSLQSDASHKSKWAKAKTVQTPAPVAPAVQPDPPVKMRYYGGPKSPMYPG
jgi:hypothetical protein